jgi:predicted PurR-regulated permease PerM
VASRASRITFFLVFAFTGFLFYRTMRPIFVWVGIGAFCAILTWNPYVAMVKRLRRRRLAAGLCTAMVLLTIVAPMAVTGYAIVDQGISVADQLSSEGEGSSAIQPDGEGVPAMVPHRLHHTWLQARKIVPVTEEQVRAFASNVAQRLARSLTGIVSGAVGVAVGIFLSVLSLYYFYLDGEGWLRSLAYLIPLPERHSVAFFQEFRRVTHAVFFGSIVTAALVGIVCTIGLAMVGVSGALLLGAVAFVAAILPVIGSGMVWGPVAAWLALHGRPEAAIFLVIWCVAWTLVLDHVFRPVITRGHLEMHPLMVFLSIFGGLAAFGFAGLLLGPLFAALFLAAVRIYAAEFPPKSPPPPVPEPPSADTGPIAVTPPAPAMH